MATESGNFVFTLTAVLLVSILAPGCNATMPGKPVTKSPSVVTDSIVGSRIPVSSSADATLPRQEYSSTGEKVPYVMQPNPYTTDAVTVPAEARSIFVSANNRLQEGDLAGANSSFTMLTEKYPTLSGPWLKLGVIAENQERYLEAIKHYKKAISVNRNNVNAYMALGLIQRKQGYFSDAFQTYLDALTVWKDFPEAHLNLAILYDLYLNNAEEAQKHYEAYYFLTGKKEEKVQKWLVEVRHRTGIDQSYIDTPPATAVVTATDVTSEAVSVATTSDNN
jgi:tetratricopeptide (TPR) repeat protein